jgi:hypothetical protein
MRVMPEYAPKAPAGPPQTTALTRVAPRPSSADVEASAEPDLDSSQTTWHPPERVRDLARLQRQLNGNSRVTQLKQLSSRLQKPNAGTATIQRKVGFEFEATSGWKVDGRQAGERAWKEIKHTKRLLLMGPNRLGGLSSDNGHAEWVSVPLSSADQVAAAHADFQVLIERVLGAAGGKLKLQGEEQAFATAQSNDAQHRFTGSGTPVRTKAQATLGIAAGSIPQLFETLLGLSQAKVGRRDEAGLAAQGIANPDVTFGMPRALAQGPDVIKKSIEQSRVVPADPESPTEASSFVMILLKTITDARHRPAAGEDPKYAFPMMPRTDFGSMFTSLKGETQALLVELWGSGTLLRNIGEAIGTDVTDPLFVKGYRQEDKGHNVGPTINEWLASVFRGGGGKDLLSPPPGFPRHVYDDETKQPEGLGAMGPDRDNRKLLLFELRRVTKDEVCTSEDWLNIMLAFAKVTGIVTSDPALIPPGSPPRRR